MSQPKAAESKKAKDPWKHVLAGGGAGAIEATVMYPMEFGKVCSRCTRMKRLEKESEKGMFS